MPANRGDPGRPDITITVGYYTFKNVLCDFVSSVTIMPKVIYEKINGSPLMYTTMCLHLVDLSLCYPEGILNGICLGVGSSYVAADFAVVETREVRTPQSFWDVLFLATVKAVIYADTAKIVFTINGKKERFSCKNKILRAPAHPNIHTLKNTSQLSRRKGGIEGGTKRTINLDYTWRKFR
jgi:hypothetical protein